MKAKPQLARTLPFRQRGIGFAGMLILVLVFGLLMTAGTKLAPLYLDHNTISNLMDKMAEEDGLAEKRRSELVELLKNRMKLNNIRDFPLEDHLEVKQTKNGTELVLDYEQRVPLVGNVDLLASFNKEIELRN